MDTIQPDPNQVVSYQQPVQPPQQPLPQQPTGRSLRISKKMFIIGGIIALILLITGVTLFLKHRSNVATNPEFVDTLLATVGSQKIYKSDVAKAAAEQYRAPLITSEILKNFYPIVLERAILEEEAKRLNISVTQNEIMTNVNAGSNSTTISQAQITAEKYALLQAKIMEKQVKNITAYTIGFWIASYDDPQLPIYETQRSDGIAALDEIERTLKAGIAPREVTKNIYSKYPSLKERLAFNDYIFENITDETVFIKPKLYSVNPARINEPSADKYFFNAILKIKEGEIVKVNNLDGTGGTVIQAVSVNTNGYSTYNEFIEAKKKELVITHAVL